MTLALVDIQSGNLLSVENALRAAGASDVIVTADPDAIARADRIVLPGVGAFGACAANLRAVDGLEAALRSRVLDQGAPFLGICVGMQLLAEQGEELGQHRGLGWLPGNVRRLDPAGTDAKVPHMGWNDVVPTGDHPLLRPGEAYFLHSFAYDGDGVLAQTDHAGPVTAAIGRDTIVGVQFHPEKSQRYGLDLLARFLEWRP
ncbi:imidazole glycerol phosphate synthase subunit HisH [Sphingomonas sp. ABOLG]|uniref:Imidazole glycerol phosphate synthase subunit HisH n=1 Tax=Sphingomonas olei TaxID=1886787 RepID=A0ABY2QHY1_9SPHN|nr:MULTISPECIES: imidazole glycerol phosphate synthase subunit HisH [Sphingomonas]KKI17738.1 imidazole glycerol phosphate synthase subunit HisH [Sphingomonas sp. Ag1]RSV18967.1 imidazole glycerol phosphate synthase subunit HisH [Sphingomonas sp. ABOLG]THG39950.1 imidazole glycerol phosphate synthase subunit HisH [Sphingomonas olei]